MNPLRAFFLTLSRMPPALMLTLIIGLAVMVTVAVAPNTARTVQYQAQAEPAAVTGPHKKAAYSRTYIPAGSKIEDKQIELRDTNDLELWDDAELATSSAVGNIAKHAIPANTQIRKIDIDNFSSQ
jgi:flagella basal body P-ring formation protein FlgA